VKRLLALAICLLAGCGSQPPPLVAPDRIESFCGGSTPSGAQITAILSSVSDRIESSTAYPGDAEVLADVKDNGGAIGTWASQPLYMPATAQALGIAGSYIDVTSVAIDNLLAGTESRLIYVTVSTPNGSKGLVLRAYDISNICVVGTQLNSPPPN
jgi:hypothetical protein